MIAKRLRWMAVGAVVSYASKAKTKRDIDRATDAFHDRLPDPVQRAVTALPGDLSRFGGAVVVAKNNATTTAKATVAITRAAGSAGRAAGSATNQVIGARRSMVERLHAARAELGNEIEHERRRLKSDAVRESEGEAAALDVLLDLRIPNRDPLPEVTAPVARGRRRHVPALPAPPVARRQRTYLPPANAWDRPSRKPLR